MAIIIVELIGKHYVLVRYILEDGTGVGGIRYGCLEIDLLGNVVKDVEAEINKESWDEITYDFLKLKTMRLQV